MAPEFASNVAHCDQILVSLIRLRPRVKLSTTHDAHLLCTLSGLSLTGLRVRGCLVDTVFRTGTES